MFVGTTFFFLCCFVFNTLSADSTKVTSANNNNTLSLSAVEPAGNINGTALISAMDELDRQKKETGDDAESGSGAPTFKLDPIPAEKTEPQQQNLELMKPENGPAKRLTNKIDPIIAKDSETNSSNNTTNVSSSTESSLQKKTDDLETRRKAAVERMNKAIADAKARIAKLREDAKIRADKTKQRLEELQKEAAEFVKLTPEERIKKHSENVEKLRGELKTKLAQAKAKTAAAIKARQAKKDGTPDENTN